MAIGASADKKRNGASGDILCRHFVERPLDLKLALTLRQINKPFSSCLFRNVAEEIVNRFGTDHTKHVAAVGIRQGQIAHVRNFRK